jgi:hypothetical protein
MIIQKQIKGTKKLAEKNLLADVLSAVGVFRLFLGVLLDWFNLDSPRFFTKILCF